MARGRYVVRYVGDAKILLKYSGYGRDFEGKVVVGGKSWSFTELRPPPVAMMDRRPIPAKIYDALAEAAADFGAYYTTGNRGDLPSWAPSAEMANAIQYAVSIAQDEHGRYEIRRRR